MQDLTENFEQSVEFYKNGVKLIKEARDLLEKAKLEVTEIQNESAQ